MTPSTREDDRFAKRIARIAHELMMGGDVSAYDVYDVVAANLWLRTSMKVPQA